MTMSYESDLKLRLGLPGTERCEEARVVKSNKRPLPVSDEDCFSKSSHDAADDGKDDPETTPFAKAPIVGWPPIRSYRKNCFQPKKIEAETAGIYIKVSMDGAPYLRKTDLKNYKSYPELLKALEDMFKCFTIVEIARREGCNGSDYAATYEDKDGDWMLVGDVPWDMFISSCKRLRIMKGSEARGLGSGI